MEQLHKAAVEELQNKLKDKELAYTELHKKLTREKEVAVDETKKKQWVFLAVACLSYTSYTFCYFCIFRHGKAFDRVPREVTRRACIS